MLKKGKNNQDHTKFDKSFNFFVAKIFFICCLFLFPFGLNAATFTWDGGGDGTTWTEAANWDLDNSYPGFDASDSDVAIIGSGNSVSLAVSANLQELRISDNVTLTLSGSGPKLTVTTTIRITNDNGASQATINGIGEVITGGGNNATSIGLDSTADSLSIKNLQIQNGTATLTTSDNDTVIVTDAVNWVDGDLTLGTGATFTHPGLTIPTGSTMKCNTATINAQGTWTFDGTFTQDTCTIVWTANGTIAGTTAPTFYQVTINSGVTVTQNLDISIENTWDNSGIFISSSNTVTVADDLTMQGNGSNQFEDLTIGSSNTLTLSATGSNATIHVGDTLTINGILACAGANTVTVDGTWDNNNGASGFDEGPDPASTAEGSRVVFGGTTCNLPDVDETFMDIEIKSTVNAVARAHYNVNRTWWASENTFSPSTFVVTFDTTLEYQNPGAVWNTRGILQGEATFNIVHINEGDVNQDPNKSLVIGSIMNAAAIHVDLTELDFNDTAIIRTDKIVFGEDAEWDVNNTTGTPTLMDRGSKFSFSYRGNEPDVDALTCINIDNNGMVFESTADVDDGELKGISFRKTTIGATGVYLVINNTGGATIDVDGCQFDENCEFNVRTPSSFTGQLNMEGFGGAKGGSEFEDDEESGEDASGGATDSIRWPAFHWTGATDSDADDANNWYPPGGPPNAVETAIVSTDDINVCNINVDESWGSLVILSGGVVTQDGDAAGLDVNLGGIFVEADTGDGDGVFVYESGATDDINVEGDVENQGVMIIGGQLNTEGNVINSGTLTIHENSLFTQPAEFLGSFTNTSTGVTFAGDATFLLNGNFLNEGTFNAQTSTLRLNGRTQDITSGGTSFHNFQLEAFNGEPLKVYCKDDLTITNELQFDVQGTNNFRELYIEEGLVFSGSGILNTDLSGSAVDGFIIYCGDAAQNITVPPAAGDNYYNLIIKNSSIAGAAFQAGTTTIDNSFVINSASTAAGNPNANIRLDCDWINDGTFSASTSKVIMGGAATRTIEGTEVTTFHDFNIENSTTVDIDVTKANQVNEVGISGIWRNDGTFTAGDSTIVFSGTPTETSVQGGSTTTFDTIKITGTFKGGNVTIGVADTFWNAGTFNKETSNVHFTGSDCQITGTTSFYAVTLDSATLTLGSGDDVTICERFAVEADSTLDMTSNPFLRLAKGMKVYGTMMSDGSTPTIIDTGNDFAFAISGSSAVVDIDKLNFSNPDNNGLLVESDVNESNIDLDAITFSDDDLLQTGTYIRLLETTIAAGAYNFTGMVFDNNCEFNVETQSGVSTGAVTMSGYSGDRGSEAFENDEGGGEVTDATIQWPNKLWVGGTSQSWNTASNWSPSGVPVATDTVIIPKIAAGNNTPIVDVTPITIQSLQINSGAVLTRDGSASNYSFSVISTLSIKPDEGDGQGIFFFSPGGTSTMTVDGDFNNEGIFGTDATTIQVNGTLTNSAQVTADGSGTQSFNITGNMINQLGGSFSPGVAATVTGNWDNQGTFVKNSGTVTFNGTGTIFSGGDDFFRAVIPTGASPTATDAFVLTNILSVLGTFNVQDSLTFGTQFDEFTGTVKFNGTGTQTVPAETYYNLEIDKSSQTATAATGATIGVLNDLTLTNGIFDGSNATINLEGDFVNNATFTASTTNVVFTGTSQEVQGTSQTNFYDLTIDTGATLVFNNTATNQNESNIADDWTNNGTFTPSDAEITFTGSASSVLGTTSTTFDSIIIDTTGTLDIANTGNEILIQSLFENNGVYTTGTSTLKFVGSGFWAGSTATTVKTIEVLGSLTMGSGDDVSVETFTLWNTGTFNMNDTAILRFTTGGALDVKGSMTMSGTTPTLTTSPTSVQFTFDVQNDGSLDINAANIANLDNNGINITATSSATVDIDNVSFTDATSGNTGTYIKWERASPAANEYVFSGLSFDDNCQFNVESPSTAAVGAFTLTGWGGARGGPTFENDKETGGEVTGASSTIDWPSSVWDGGAGTSNWNDATNWNPDTLPTATDNVQIPSTPSANVIFPSLNISPSIGSLLIEDGASVTTDGGSRSLTISGTLEIETDSGAGADGVLTFDSTGTLQVDGQVTVNGRLDFTTTGSLDFNGDVTTGSGSDFFSTGGGTVDIEGSLTVAGEVQPEIFFVAGNFDSSSGTFTQGTSVVTLDGASGTVDVGSGSFYRLSVPSGSEYTSDSTNTLTISNRLVVGGILNIAGPSSITGVLDPITGTIRYSGTATQTINALDYYNLEVTNTTANVSFTSGTTSVINDFTIADNATTLGSTALIQVTGDWVNNNTFTANTSTVSFDGANSTIEGDSKTTFNNLFISSSAALDVNTTASPADEVQVDGNWTNDGTYTTGTSHVIFGGTSVLQGASVTTFDDITINTSSSLSLAGVNRFDWSDDFTDNGTLTPGTSTIGVAVGTGMTLTGTATETVFEQLEVLGELTVSSKNFQVETLNVWGTGTLDIQGSTTLELGSTGTKGTASIRGSFASSGSTPTVSHVDSEFSFDVLDSGTVDIDALNFSNPDDDGLHINSTASTSFDIDSVDFTNGNTGAGTYLTLSLASIPADTYSFLSLQFDSNTNKNIRTPGTAANDAVTVPGWGGAKGGEDFENDRDSGTISGGSILWPQKEWDAGGLSSLWSVAANWSPDGVPTAGEQAVIPNAATTNGLSPYFDGSFSVGSISIKSGGSVTNDGASNSITVNGSVEIEYDTGNGQAAITADASSGVFTCTSVSNDGTFRAANSTFTIDGNVRNTKWLNNEATLMDLNGDLVNTASTAVLMPGRMNISGSFTNSSSANIVEGTSVITFDGTTTQNVSVGSENFYQLQATGTGTVAILESLGITNALSVNTGTVTAGNVTLTFSDGALLDVSSSIKFDSTTLTTPTPGTNRFKAHINSGADIHAKQTTVFDSLNDEGMIFATGSQMGTNTTASNGTQNFRFVTFDNIGNGGLGIDFSALVAGDDSKFPEILREIRFNAASGATTAQNVKGGDSADPRFVFHLNTGNFGTVATNGEDGDDDANNRIIWNTSANYISLEYFQSQGSENFTAIDLTWKTIVEIGNNGFNLYRSKDKHEGFVKITDELIEPGGPGNGIEGYEYLYTDTNVDPGEVFYYKLEDIDYDGNRTFHGPITVDWDKDGIADDWELANGFDNLDASDAQEDADGDGLNNLDEYLYGLDPHNPDSDNDGILDGDEDLIPSELGSGPGINVGSALKIIGQDALGMTLELNLEGLDIEDVNKLWAPWKDNSGYRRWSSKDFKQVMFKGDLKTETLTQKGLPAVPVCHTLFNVPENRIFETKIILEEWGQTEILNKSLIPVPTYQDVPVSDADSNNFKSLKDFKRRNQGKLWQQLFGKEKKKAKKIKRRFKNKFKSNKTKPSISNEVEPEEPQTELIEIYAMDPSAYKEDKFYPETHFSAQKRSKVGDQQTILLAVQPVKYNPQRGELKHLKRLRFRIDYIWDPDHLAKTTAQWQQYYNKLNHAEPEYLKQHVSLKFEVSKPSFNAQVGDMNDAGLFKLTWADFEDAGYDIAEAKKNPGGIRIFQGDVELSLKEIVDESSETNEVAGFVFFTDSGLNETLFSKQVVLYAFYDSETSGKRWDNIVSEANFDQKLEFSTQRIRYEDNKPQNLGTAYLQDRVGDSFYFGPNAFKTSTKSVAFGTPGILSDTPVELISRFWGVHPQESGVGQGLNLSLNSEQTPFASPQWPGQAYHQEKSVLNGDQFVPEGTNTFKFQGYFPAEVPTSSKIRSRFDWLEVLYQRELKALDNRYLIDMSLPDGVSRIAVKGFSEESKITVLDVSDAGDVKEITETQRVLDEISFNYKNPEIEVVDSVYYPNFLRIDSDYGHDDPNGRGNFGFGTDTGSVESLKGASQLSHPSDFYLERYSLSSREVYEGVHHKGPRLLLTDLNSAKPIENPELSFRGFIRRLHAPITPITHMVVVAKPLMEECERLKDHLEAQGQHVEMVSFEDLCKEYTFGQYSSNAIYLYVQERFLMSFNPKPKFLTIVGSGNLDVSEFYTQFLSEKPLIPSVMVRGGVKVAAADGYFALITREGIEVDRFPDLAVGRIDCGTVDELSAILDKIQGYDLLEPNLDETNKAILVADKDKKISDIFEQELDKVEQSFEEGWEFKRLHKSELSGAAIANEIMNDLHTHWVQLLFYCGHGNFPTWSDVFSVGNVGQLNANMLPFVLEANCQAADYFHFAVRSLGTHWLQRPNGGAIAVAGTTSRTNSNDKIDLLYLIGDNLLRRGYPQFGMALWRAKVEALTTDPDDRRAILTQHLLGLPSQKLKSGLESKP